MKQHYFHPQIYYFVLLTHKHIDDLSCIAMFHGRKMAAKVNMPANEFNLIKDLNEPNAIPSGNSVQPKQIHHN